jgi:hypothetical protein
MRTLSLVFLLAILGCGSGDDAPPDNDDPDAMVAGPVNGLGMTCTVAAECPSDPVHDCVFLASGNPNLGYCSPVCATDPDCTTGFSGPGTATCFVPGQANLCSVTCATDLCPGDLICADLGGGGVKICVTQ